MNLMPCSFKFISFSMIQLQVRISKFLLARNSTPFKGINKMEFSKSNWFSGFNLVFQHSPYKYYSRIRFNDCFASLSCCSTHLCPSFNHLTQTVPLWLKQTSHDVQDFPKPTLWWQGNVSMLQNQHLRA